MAFSKSRANVCPPDGNRGRDEQVVAAQTLAHHFAEAQINAGDHRRGHDQDRHADQRGAGGDSRPSRLAGEVALSQLGRAAAGEDGRQQPPEQPGYGIHQRRGDQDQPHDKQHTTQADERHVARQQGNDSQDD